MSISLTYGTLMDILTNSRCGVGLTEASGCCRHISNRGIEVRVYGEQSQGSDTYYACERMNSDVGFDVGGRCFPLDPKQLRHVNFCYR